MTNLEKYGLFLMLLGVVSFRDGGWFGGLGTLLLIGGFMMFLWDTKDAPNTRLHTDGRVRGAFCEHGYNGHCPVCDALNTPPAGKA